MPNEKPAEKYRDKTTHHLENTFGSLGLAELVETDEQLESLLLLRVKEAIEETAAFTCKCVKKARNPYLVGPVGEHYELSICHDIKESSTLDVSIIGRDPQVPKVTARRTARVSGYGRTKRVRLYVCKTLDVDVDLLCSIVTAVLEAGYEWMTHQIEELSSSAELSLVDHLYRELRRIVKNDLLQDNLWFSCVTKGHGFRLIEPSLVKKAFPLIDKHANEFGYGANRLVGDLISTRLPCEGLLMHACAQINQCMDGDMAQARYKHDGSTYLATLISLYGKEAFTIFPLYVSSVFSVLTLFPTEARSSLEPLLERHRDELSHLIAKEGKSIASAFSVFDQRKSKRFDLEKLNEVFQMKPNFFGIGVDFNKIVSWMREAGKGK
jgi:hypothetical protein